MIQTQINYDKRQWGIFRTDQGKVRRSLPMGRGVAGMQARDAAILSSELWMQLGKFAIQTIRERVAKGLGSSDQAMPALKNPGRKMRWSISQKKQVEYGSSDSGYPAFKRRLGLKPIRDLYGPGGLVVSYRTGNKRYTRSGTKASRAAHGGRGHMLDDIRVTYVDEASCKIDISNSASRVKARANEKRAPWIGFSPNDRKTIMAEFRRLFKVECRDFTDVFRALGLVASRKFGSVLRRAA